MSEGLRLISIPLTEGTIQNVQLLLQPIWIVTKALTLDSRTAAISVSISVVSSIISVIGPQSSAWLSKLITSVVLCVPITTSTQGALSRTNSLSF